MSRIRTVKPSLFSSPTMARVSVAARYTCIGLLTEADDEGRFLASPKRIVGVLFPHDAGITANKVEEYLALLESVGTIRRYVVDGITYGYFPEWGTHQKISHATPSLLPSPSGAAPESRTKPSGSVPEPLRQDSGLNREEGKEQGTGNREQGSKLARAKPSRSRKTPESFAAWYSAYPRHEKPADAERAYVKALTLVGADVLLEAAKRYRDDPNREDGFTMHPASWLNGRCWNDDPLPKRSNGSEHPLDRMARRLIEGVSDGDQRNGQRSSPAPVGELPRVAGQ